MTRRRESGDSRVKVFFVREVFCFGGVAVKVALLVYHIHLPAPLESLVTHGLRTSLKVLFCKASWVKTSWVKDSRVKASWVKDSWGKTSWLKASLVEASWVKILWVKASLLLFSLFI